MERPGCEDGEDLPQAPCVRFAVEGAITGEYEPLTGEEVLPKRVRQFGIFFGATGMFLAEESAALCRDKIHNS